MQAATHIVWNIFLALVPAVLGIWIARGVTTDRKSGYREPRWSIWVPAILIWLAFLPNTIYLLTEWRHYLHDVVEKPEWLMNARRSGFDLAEFILVSSWYVGYTGLGLLTFFVAVWPLDRVFKPPLVWRLAFFAICALGVYLGLIPRLNSWDIVFHPLTVAHIAARAFFNAKLLSLVIGFAIVIYSSYTVFDIFMDGLAVKLKRTNIL